MQAKLTQTFVDKVKPSEKLLRIRDTYTKGLVLFVNPGGKKTYFVDFRRRNGKRADYKIGCAARFSVPEAREAASKFLAAIERGEDPTVRNNTAITLGDFIKDIYGPWVVEHRKSGDLTVAMIKSNFEHFFNTPLDCVNVALIEHWRMKKKKDHGVKSSSLNRTVTALKAAVNWAVKRDIIGINPLSKLEPLSERDSAKIIRYLSDGERARLMAAFDERDKEIREKWEKRNEWLKVRKLKPLPRIKDEYFADHLKPIVLLALSTGIRRNSLLSLVWEDICFAERRVFVRADAEKTEKERYVPLNNLAFETLTRWHKQSKRVGPRNLVFPSPKTGKKLNNCNSSWRSLLKKAGIEKFRWHDMRHDFASQLVMKGADLNTVRELLGHADLKMTLVYAHLAPENKLRAVELLDD